MKFIEIGKYCFNADNIVKIGPVTRGESKKGIYDYFVIYTLGEGSTSFKFYRKSADPSEATEERARIINKLNALYEPKRWMGGAR